MIDATAAPRRGPLSGVYLLVFFLRNATAQRWLLVLLALLLGGSAARAQIVDDTTKVLYGPKTTRVIYERDVRRDSVRGTRIDTTLTLLPQTRFWLHDSTFQQDLGQLATASRPLLYQPNLALGNRLGRNVFDRNTHDGSQVPYYDSRSPYSFFRYIQGSLGEQVFELSYSRSFKKDFSIGIDYERIASNQVLYVASNQYLVEHNNFTLYSRYQTEDGRYHLLANYSASRQLNREQGGIWPYTHEQNIIKKLQNGSFGNTLFKYSDERTYLTAATNIDDRDQLHVFQSLRLLGRGLTAYHILDLRRQFNGYLDTAVPYDSLNKLAFYPATLRNRTATVDRATYRQFENTLGLQGHSDRFEYNVYARYRTAELRAYTTPFGLSGAGLRLVPASPRFQPRAFLDTPAQLFAGGTLSFTYRSIYAVQVEGEIKPSVSSPEFWLRGRVRTGPLSVEALASAYSPTLTQQSFAGNHYQWYHGEGSSRAFNNTKTLQLTGRLQQPLPLLAEHSIELRADVVHLNSYVYYNQNGEPDQAGNETLLVGMARHRVRLGSVYFDNQATYTQTTGSDALRVPKLVGESRVYYQRRIFGRALFGQFGAEAYFQSQFQLYNYSPSTQQFYLQDTQYRGYVVANVFAAADISSASIFLKFAYANQGLGTDGYFASPYFSGYPRRFQFGVRWKFFN